MAVKFDRSRETMTSRERVRRVFAGEIPDRIPINYFGNKEINKKMMEYIGTNDYGAMLETIGVDFRRVTAPYTGPKLFDGIPGRAVDPLRGIHTRWIEHETGGYWDYCDFPLAEATEEEIAQWPFPDPDDFDYEAAHEYAEANAGYALHAGGTNVSDILNGTGMLFGVEQTLVDLITDDPACLLYIKRKQEYDFAVMERLLHHCSKLLVFMWMGEDLGSQRCPLISINLYRKHLKPYHKKLIDLASSYNLPTIIHSCGSSSWAYPDFIEMGMRGVDTLQPEAKDMSPQYLKDTFGGRLIFQGCISTAGPVAFGTPDEVEADIRGILDIMMPGGGYIFAPTHSLQDNSPVENVVRMYECALKYGYYN
jgi:uroporphyrinogen decarboxylase